MKPIIYILFFLFSFAACTDYTPKPMAYPRIDRDVVGSTIYNNMSMSFIYPSDTFIKEAMPDNDKELWFNIIYPQYKATIHCTYLPITKSLLKKALEDDHKLVYSHALKAGSISKSLYANPQKEVYGTIYDIEGSVATPIQFFVTDSVSHFFRGSLYYDYIVKADSVKPVTEFIRTDIIRFIETMEWK